MHAERGEKRQIFEALLQEAASVFVHLDARLPGALTPKQFWTEHNLCLEYGLNLVVPIVDLKITDEGIQATLSFNREPVFTVVPWDAAYAFRSSEGHVVVFPGSVPSEYQLSIPEGPAVPIKRKQPGLRLVEDGAVFDGRSPDEAPPVPSGPFVPRIVT